MEDLLNEYMELLNKAELNRAVALKLGKDEIVKSQETKMCCYGEFVRRLNEKTGDKYLIACEVTTATYMGVEVSYHRTLLLG